MAGKVRAIFDATGLTVAPQHYRMFPWEPSIDPKEDMEVFFDDKLDMIRQITLEKVMERMVALVGEKVVLIVSHGTKGGFFMPIVAGSEKAVALNLESLTKVWEAHKVAARLRLLAKIFGKRDQYRRWQELLRTLPGGENAVVAPGQSEQADKIYTKWETAELRKYKISLDKLRDVMVLRDRLADKKFERIEIRACNMGASTSELEFIRVFLGAKKIIAPNQDTFFGTTKPEFLKPTTTLLQWLKKNGGNEQFMIDGGFALKITEIVHARYTTKAASVNEQAVKDWVHHHVMTNSTKLSTKEFHVMALRSRQDPKNRHPFTFPLDANYRKLLVRKG